MTETLVNGYSIESTQRELSDEYQHDRVKMVYTNLCILVLWAKVVSALEGLSPCIAYEISLLKVILTTGHCVQVKSSLYHKSLA